MQHNASEEFDPYEELANAIVMQACIDYIKWQKQLASRNSFDISYMPEKQKKRYERKSKKLQSEIKKIEVFFFSPEYAMMTNLDPAIVLGAVEDALAQQEEEVA